MSAEVSLMISAQLREITRLTQDLSSLQVDPVVSALLSSVVQDPQTETISFAASRASIMSRIHQSDLINVRRARTDILKFLNAVMFHSLGFTKWLSSDAWCIWFWENHTRLCKLATLGMALESNNLIVLGAKPEKMDIPQALIRVPRVISFMRGNQFRVLEAYHLKCIEELGQSPDFGPDYLNVFLN